MKTNMEKAREAFKEKFGAMPEEKGFVIVEDIGGKICFAKNSEAMESYKKGNEVKKEGIKSFFVIFILAFLIWWLYPCVGHPNENEMKFCFVLIFFTSSYIVFRIHSEKEREYRAIEEEWKDEVIAYDYYEEKIVT